jgi:hypothetical protein
MMPKSLKKIIGIFIRHKWAILIALTLLFLFANLHLKGYLTKNIYTSGDEPHYLMMTDSLVKDGDLNLKNDYENNRAEGIYSKNNVFPHLSATIDPRSSNNWYSIHTIGLPLIIYGPYSLFGLNGARLAMVLLQLTSLGLFYLALKRYLSSDNRVFLGVTLILSCTFFWQNLGAILPDMLVVVFSLVFIVLFGNKKFISNLALAFLIFLSALIHTKIALILLPLYLGHNILLIKELGARNFIRLQLIPFVLLAVCVVAYSFFLHRLYGFYTPNGLYGSNGQLFSANPFINLMAILFDRVKGLVFYYPVLLVAGPYIFYGLIKFYSAVKKSSLKNFTAGLALAMSLAVGSSILIFTQITFSDWSGSFAPSGRYMLVPIFIVVFLIAKYFNPKNKLELTLLLIMAVLSVAISIGIIYRINIYREMSFVYLGSATDSIITERFALLQKIPKFSEISSSTNYQNIHKGGVLMLLYALFNLVIFMFYGKGLNNAK